jgi:hypothetical protein
MRTISDQLAAGGDRRSIGRSNQVVEAVLREPRRFAELIRCLWHENVVVRIRAADAAEKVSKQQPELLLPYRRELLGLMEETDQIELRWHMALMVPRLPLTSVERQRGARTFERYLNDKSSIVRTFALQALTDLSANDHGLRVRTKLLLEGALQSGTAAMKARARKLLKSLKAEAV